MADTPQVTYEHDNAVDYEFYCKASGHLEFPQQEVSPVTGTPKVPGSARVFKVLTFLAKLSTTNWKSLHDKLVAIDSTDFDDTYPRVTYKYEAGSTITFKCMPIKFEWVQLNEGQVMVTMTVKEYK